jgi:hypothetical protein
MGKGPVHLVLGVAVNKRYRTVFGMEKIDQGRHEGALTTTTFSPIDMTIFFDYWICYSFSGVVCLSAKVSQAQSAASKTVTSYSSQCW